MKRRVLCFLLSAVLLLSVMVSAVPSVSAANYMKSSDKLIALIKEFEGFSPKAKYDYGQYSIGYGTVCDPDDYPDGITEEQADKLLREHLAKYEKSVNTFVAKYGLTLKQHQFDALVSFTYNLGSSWMNNDTAIRKAVLDGAKGNEFIFAITQYCTAGVDGVKTILPGLVNRRLGEANMYLNGKYSKTAPSNYKYVIFDNNIEEATSTVRIQGYDASINDVIRATPSKLGHTFLGWYTKAEGGEVVTTVGPKTAVSTLYAHWQKGDGEKDKDGKLIGVAAEYKHTPVSEQAVYDAPGGKQTGKIAAGKTVEIVADYMDSKEIKWGKLSTGGWISIGKTGIQGAGATAQAVDLTIKITTNGVNVRKGPGTEFQSVAKLNYGKEITITHVQKGGKYTWGRYADGWVCLQYTNYDMVSFVEGENSDEVTAVGVIVGTDKVNIRNYPGTSGTKIVGQYSRGDIVKVTLQYKVGNTIWCKTEKGWVSSMYMELTSVEDEPAETKPGETKPESDEKITAVGVIVGADKVRIRNMPGVNGTKIVGYYERGEVITITLQQKVGNNIWGKTDKGWVSCYYVDLTPIDDESQLPPEATKPEATEPEATQPDPTVPDATEPGATEPSNPKPEQPQPDADVIAVGVVDNCTSLRVRAGTSTNYKQVDSLAAGTEVYLYEITTVGGQAWGRIGTGRWVCLSYVDFEFIGFDQVETVDAVVANCYNVNVRVAPGTKYALARTLPAGTKVKVAALYVDKTITWAFTPYGWISVKYLTVVEGDTDIPDATEPGQGGTGSEPSNPGQGGQPGTGGTVTTVRKMGTVTGTNTLRVRSAPGSNNKQVGTLKRGDKVIITETFKVGNTDWGKIGEGQWISLYYVKLSDDAVSEDAFTKIVTADKLKIRAEAGADKKQVGTYAKGTQVMVYETVQIGNATWGRTDKGWISLYYTK